MSGEERGTIEDYLMFTLDDMSEKLEKLREALPLLDRIDMEKVRQGDVEAASFFLGRFFVVFQPVESLAHRMSNYWHWTTKQKISGELREQVKLLGTRLGFDEAQIALLDKLARVRNKVAHAYWNMKEEELTDDDIKAARHVLEELTRRVDAFVVSERKKLIDHIRRTDGCSRT